MVNDVIFPSGCDARAINLGNKNMKIGIFTGGTSVRSKNIFTDISRYLTSKHKINVFCRLQVISPQALHISTVLYRYSGNFGPISLAHHKKVMSEMYQRDKNRPAVIIWSVANEPATTQPEAGPYFK